MISSSDSGNEEAAALGENGMYYEYYQPYEDWYQLKYAFSSRAFYEALLQDLQSIGPDAKPLCDAVQARIAEVENASVGNEKFEVLRAQDGVDGTEAGMDDEYNIIMEGGQPIHIFLYCDEQAGVSLDGQVFNDQGVITGYMQAEIDTPSYIPFSMDGSSGQIVYKWGKTRFRNRTSTPCYGITCCIAKTQGRCWKPFKQ